MAVRSQFTISDERATGKWQLDAHSILEEFIQFQVNRKRQTAARCQFAHSCESSTGNRQPDANTIIDGLRRLKPNRLPANGTQISIH